MGILKRLFQKDPRDNLKKMAGEFKLPAFPKVAMQVRKLLRKENSTNLQIGECLKRDAGLTVRVLQSVNSAASARRRRIADPVAAVGLLGRANLEYLVLAHATRDAIPNPKNTGYTEDQFWDIAQQRAALAERISREVKPSEAGVAYTASLLQDMAVPMLAQVMRKQYRPLLAASEGDWAVLDEREREALGWDHGEFGGWMCEAWQFPDVLTAAVTSHHRDVHEELEVPAAVRVVSFLDSRRLSPAQTDQLIVGLDESFGMSANDSRRMLEDHFAA
jgi:HD-like signal output (HDOD) protein